MTDSPLRRRRSPEWVRQLAQDSLHGLAWRLQRDYRLQGLSDGQDALLTQCISELEWRHVHPDTWANCNCDLCVLPFPFGEVVGDLEVEDRLDWLEP